MANPNTQESPFPTENLLTVRETAARLHLTTMTVYRMVKSGQLRAVHLGPQGRTVRIYPFLPCRQYESSEAEWQSAPGRSTGSAKPRPYQQRKPKQARTPRTRSARSVLK